MAFPKNISGKKFGYLTARHYAGKGTGKWLCLCDCGNRCEVRTDSLTGGNTKSCGCKGRRFKHGLSGTRTYRIWLYMKSRCQSPTDTAYHNYGAKGISICDRWNVFENFLEDMGMCPEGYEIDRIDYTGNYEPSNCRWATRRTQNLNKRNNRRITWQGRTQTLTEWAEELSLTASTLTHRLNSGWPLERAMTPKSFNRDQVILEHNGEKLNVTEWSKRTGINRETLYARIYKGWDVERIITTPARKKSDVKS